MNDLKIYIRGYRQLTTKGERKQNMADKVVRHSEECGFAKFACVLALPFAANAGVQNRGY
jgi:hypothetical protein